MKYDRIEGFKPGRKKEGLARALSGDVHVSVYFISHVSDCWRDEDISLAKASLSEGERWLVSKAARYGKKLSFRNTYFGDADDAPIRVRSFMSLEETGYWDMRKVELKILRKRKLDNWNNYLALVRDRNGCRQGINVFIYVKPARSYSLWAYGKYMFDTAVCHREDDAGTFAHEILHLFGAWDMYTRHFDKGKARGLKCAEYFRSSIMRQTNIYPLTSIDEINAWLVGLKEEEKPWYYLFFPEWEEKEEEIGNLKLYWDWRTREYSDKPIPPEPLPAGSTAIFPKKTPSFKLVFVEWKEKITDLPKVLQWFLAFLGLFLVGIALSPLMMLLGYGYSWIVGMIASVFFSVSILGILSE